MEGHSGSATYWEKRIRMLEAKAIKMEKRVIRLLDAKNPAYVIFEGASALFHSSKNGVFSQHRLENITIHAGAVNGLISLLSLNLSRDRNLVGLKAFYELIKSERNRVLLASWPGVIKKLVDLFSRNTDFRTQLLSLQVFSMLAESCEVNLEIGAIPGVTTSLVSLTDHAASEIQITARYVLTLLRTIKYLHKCNVGGQLTPRTLFDALSNFTPRDSPLFRSAAVTIINCLNHWELDKFVRYHHLRTVARLVDLHNPWEARLYSSHLDLDEENDSHEFL